MRMLNLGILAHVDAGKTSLTERLLFETGAITRLGAVDDGTTQTDAMDLERRRGITIRSAVATFTAGDLEVHLIDTPGHADFVAEVQRAVGVLDGAVLVISAVEGVQPQTRVLLRVLAETAVPTVLFVNKIDRAGARDESLLADLRRVTGKPVVAVGSASGLGTRAATAGPRRPGERFTAELVEVLGEHDDSVLETYLYDPASLDHGALRRGFAALARAAKAHPVVFGSAITGAGVATLRDAVAEFLPPATDRPSEAPDGSLDGTVFAVERDGDGRRTAVVRLFTGHLAARDVVTFARREPSGALVESSGRVTAVRAADGSPGPVGPGGIARVTGLPGLRVGDRVGTGAAARVPAAFPPPTRETVVTVRPPGRPAELFAALGELAEQDPLIDLRRGAEPGSLVVSLYGDVQQEVLAARLAGEFGLDAEFTVPTVICVERVAGVGHALEVAGEGVFPATVGLRVEPGEPGGGLSYGLEVERGSLPGAFMAAIEEAVRATLREGLRGWQVVDCRVTLTHTGYFSPVTTAGDFRGLTPLVLMTALAEAGTTVCEPFDRMTLDVPADTLSAVLGLVTRCGGIPGEPLPRGRDSEVDAVEAVLPARRLRELERALPGATRGAGTPAVSSAGYREVAGAAPARARTDDNPLNREEYLRRVLGGRP